MNTESLIRALATDAAATPRRQPWTEWRMALAGGALAAFALMQVTLHVRPDIAFAAQTPRFLFKFVVTLALALPACWLAMQLARPDSAAWSRKSLLLVAPVLLALACVAEFFATPASQWAALSWGANHYYCATCIPVFSLAPLAGIFYALSHGAPTRPGIAGLVAGLAAGGIGATAYAAHCVDDSPLFVAVWYSIGIGIVGALGAWLGPRILRW